MKLFPKQLSRLALIGAVATISALPEASQAATPKNDPNVYGYLSWCENKEDFGWYKFDTSTGLMDQVWLDKTDVNPAYFITGWVRDGKLCGIYGNHSTEMYIEYNVKTGVLLTAYEIDIEGPNHYRYIATGAYNPVDDYVYGFSFNSDFSKDYFVKAPASDISKVEIIREMPRYYTMCMSCCFNTKENMMYGIDFLGDLIRIDTYGNFDVAQSYNLNDERKLANYATGMCYSPREDCYFWNTQFASYESLFTRIDAKNYQFKKVSELLMFDHFTVLSCIDSDGCDNGPKAPEFVASTIAAGATSGEITYKMPTEMADGSEMPAMLTWTAGNGDQTLSGTAAPGEEVKVAYENLKAGQHSFEMYASNENIKGAAHFHNIWVGKDVPAYPRNLKAVSRGWGDYELSWQPVTTGAHGGHFAADDVVYAIFVNGKQQMLTSDTKAVVNLPAQGASTKYSVIVYAVNDDLLSEDAAILTIESLAGGGYLLDITPDSDNAGEMKVFNQDNDASTWSVTKDFWGDRAWFCNSDKINRADDWLITPALDFGNVDNKYELIVNMCANSNTKKDEYLEVYMGNTPDPSSMTMVSILPKTQITGTKYKEISQKFEVPETGTWYIGFHCVSNPDMAGIYLKNVKVAFTNEEASGINAVSHDKVNVRALRGGICITGAAGQEAEIYSIGGHNLSAHQVASDSENIDLEAGFYLVRCGGKTFKLVVK